MEGGTSKKTKIGMSESKALRETQILLYELLSWLSLYQQLPKSQESWRSPEACLTVITERRHCLRATLETFMPSVSIILIRQLGQIIMTKVRVIMIISLWRKMTMTISEDRGAMMTIFLFQSSGDTQTFEWLEAKRGKQNSGLSLALERSPHDDHHGENDHYDYDDDFVLVCLMKVFCSR